VICKTIALSTQKRMILVWISALTRNLPEGCDVIFKKNRFRKIVGLPGGRWRGSEPDSLLIRRPELPALKQSSKFKKSAHPLVHKERTRVVVSIYSYSCIFVGDLRDEMLTE